MIINEKEIRHEMRDKVSKVENLMSFIAKEKNINNLIVTMEIKDQFYLTKIKISSFIQKLMLTRWLIKWELEMPCLRL